MTTPTDTPLTDAAWQAHLLADIEYPGNCEDLADLARSLELRLTAAKADYAAATARAERAEKLINSPEISNFLRGVHLEAVHQVERWGTAHDRAKRDADWFWLVGYLAGKALHSSVAGNHDKALHHCISAAAALYNWHAAISGVDIRMCPGKSDLEAALEDSFGDAALSGEAHG